MRPALSAALCAALTAAYSQPGVPPQCLDSLECVFHRAADDGLAADYFWDLRSLCAGPGSEYVAQRDPTCVSDPTTGACPSYCMGDCRANQEARVVLNVCGTVAGPVAPVDENTCPAGSGQCPNGVGSAQLSPMPASHGVAVQVRAPIALRAPIWASPLPFLLRLLLRSPPSSHGLVYPSAVH